MEAGQDEQMMDEMSGVVDIKRGAGQETKATVAQINVQEANAKIDLYIAIVAETFIREFYSLLAYQIQKFETDEKVFRIANDTFRQEQGNPFIEDVYDLDFEADCIVNVGLGIVGRQTEIQQTMLVWDRAIMANQSMLQLMQIPGAIPPGGIRLVDTTAFLEDIMPKMGKKDLQRYFFQVQQPTGEGAQDPSLAGQAQGQIGDQSFANNFQAGGLRRYLMDFNTASDEELIERLDVDKMAIRLEGDENWQLVKEICRRHELVGYQFLLDCPAEETEAIRNVQATIHKYKKEDLWGVGDDKEVGQDSL